MQIKLKFLGAAQNVTGSRHLLQVDHTNILVDCGLYQERSFVNRNWDKFPIPPESIDAVLLTHAHLDHCGYLPKLVKEGFKGKIYCTPATAELTRLILLDSAHINEEDAEYKQERHRREGREGKPYLEVPLYNVKDAEACSSLFTPVEYNQCVRITNRIGACFYNAGHVLGSAIIQVHLKHYWKKRTILFAGDIGRPHAPIINDPDIFKKADYLVIESTYGDKVHGDVANIKDAIGDVIQATQKTGGNVIVPSFTLERVQEILYYVNQLRLEKPLKIFVDSPMASKTTEIFKKHPELFDPEMSELVKKGHSPFDIPGLCMVGSRTESMEIKKIKGTVMIIAGSGMCTGGRIKYHLIDNIGRPESTIMFVGYQAEGTLGRQILDGNPEVRIHGQIYPVRAKVVPIAGFSAHADRNELLQWLKNFQECPKRIFVVHGESSIAYKFRDFLKEQIGCMIQVPHYLEEAILH